jgi:hypothetical protein
MDEILNSIQWIKRFVIVILFCYSLQSKSQVPEMLI